MKEIEIDPQLETEIPHILIKIEEGIKQLPSLDPAHKRGIPVATEIVLPVILRTAEL